MNLTCRDIGLNLLLPDELLERLYSIAKNYYPKEFGGILVGYYSEDQKTCCVVNTVLPKKYKSSRYSFERGKEGLKKKLIEFYSQQPRLIYIGEWHTHPDMPAEPSETDKAAMEEIASSDDVNITHPVLLILGKTAKEPEIGAYIQFKNKLLKYE